MAKITHLFVIDPIESLNFKLDSSLRIAQALRGLGHDVAICTPNELEWAATDGCAVAYTQFLDLDPSDVSRYQLAPKKRLRLDQFSAIHMRKDPPYDMAYIACTWLLDSAAKAGVKVLNAPQALRDFNEKLSIFQFPEAIQDGLLSSNADHLWQFLNDKCNGDAVLKPLTLFGGRGVLRLNRQQQSEAEIRKILTAETASGADYRLMQPFDARIFEGEIRVFCAGGQAMAWCLKKPHGDNFLANTRSGATLEPYEPNARELHFVEQIARQLLEHGIYYLGFDLIGGHVSEINITSPRLLQASDDNPEPYNRIARQLDDLLRTNTQSN